MSLLLSSKKQWRLAISKEDKFLIKVLCEERVICAKKSLSKSLRTKTKLISVICEEVADED